MARFLPYALTGLCLLGACSDPPEVRQPGPVVLGVSGSAGDGGEGEQAAAGGVDTGPPDLPHPEPSGPPCNGAAALCESPYDATTFAVTHASMASSEAFWDFPAQRRGIRQQLDDSIRGLMLEVHDYGGKPTLCLHDCDEGRAALGAELGHVRSFLDDNPREVVTLFVDNHVAAADVAAAFDAADLGRYLYEELPEPWPTLGALIDRGTRLVVFVQDAEDAPAGFRSFRENVATTGDAFTRQRDLACDLAGDAANGPFVLINQFLVTSGGEGGAGGDSGRAPAGRPSEALAETVNHDPFLSERLESCADYLGKKPSFVALDFYDTSDVIGAVQRQNGVIR